MSYCTTLQYCTRDRISDGYGIVLYYIRIERSADESALIDDDKTPYCYKRLSYGSVSSNGWTEKKKKKKLFRSWTVDGHYHLIALYCSKLRKYANQTEWWKRETERMFERARDGMGWRERACLPKTNVGGTSLTCISEYIQVRYCKYGWEVGILCIPNCR